MENKEFDFHEIKTFEDACKKLGLNSGSLTYPAGGDRDSFLQAWYFYNLLIIQKAINNGVWCDKDGFSYSPYWMFYTKEEIESMSEEDMQRLGIRKIISCAVAPDTAVSGIRYAGMCTRRELIFTDGGFPLRFNSRKAAKYAAKQFEDLFFQYYGIKVKE